MDITLFEEEVFGLTIAVKTVFDCKNLVGEESECKLFGRIAFGNFFIDSEKNEFIVTKDETKVGLDPITVVESTNLWEKEFKKTINYWIPSTPFVIYCEFKVTFSIDI